MGNRANVVVQDGSREERIYLYSHWDGSAVLDAALFGMNSTRASDAPYLARIVFTSMLAGDTGEVGYGISTQIADNEHPIIVLDAGAEEVWFEGDDGEELTKHVPIKAAAAAIEKALKDADENDDEARYSAAMGAVNRTIA